MMLIVLLRLPICRTQDVLHSCHTITANGELAKQKPNAANYILKGEWHEVSWSHAPKDVLQLRHQGTDEEGKALLVKGWCTNISAAIWLIRQEPCAAQVYVQDCHSDVGKPWEKATATLEAKQAKVHDQVPGGSINSGQKISSEFHASMLDAEGVCMHLLMRGYVYLFFWGGAYFKAPDRCCEPL